VILENAVVHTLAGDGPPQRELAVVGGRIAARADGPRLDLDGLCVVPGLSDSHVHFPTWALAQRTVRLDGARSLAEACDRVRAALAEHGGGWLRGFGWRDAGWPDGGPTAHALDKLAPGVPIALRSKDGHSIWLSSAALALADELEAKGGVVERDGAGRPTGILREEAAWRFDERHARPSRDEFVSAMRDAIALANARGVTAVHDKDGGLGATGLWQRLREEGSLTLRVWQSLPHDVLPELEWVGLRPGLGDDLLRIGYLKVFMDGALGSRTALLLDGSGVCITSSEQLAAIVARAAAAGWPVAVHAIGDAANRAALDAFEETRELWQPRGLRQRIEHAQLLDPADVGRFAELGVAASVQYTHAPSDRDLVESVWGARGDGAYLFRTLLDSGAVVANGSDAPIEDLHPLAGLRAAVGRSLDDRPPWRPEQALTAREALVTSTVTPAWLAYDEARRGRLAPGMLADLVVLDRDPLACPPSELDRIEVVATMLGGRWVHGGERLGLDPQQTLASEVGIRA
jgi:predicted amidohydrolase YtcJ